MMPHNTTSNVLPILGRATLVFIAMSAMAVFLELLF